MVLAYLEGLLTPDYPQGVSSRIREDMILNALSLKLQADSLLAKALVNSNFSSFFDAKTIKQTLREHTDHVTLYSDLKFLDTQRLKKPSYVDASAQIYKKLDEAGLL